MATTGEDVEILLNGDPPLPHKAWRMMRGWRRAAVDHAPPPARITPERITAERMELYRVVPPPGENIPTSVPPSQNEDSVPTEEEVEWEVQIIRWHQSGGPSQMCDEHLREWLNEHREI